MKKLTLMFVSALVVAFASQADALTIDASTEGIIFTGNVFAGSIGTVQNVVPTHFVKIFEADAFGLVRRNQAIIT